MKVVSTHRQEVALQDSIQKDVASPASTKTDNYVYCVFEQSTTAVTKTSKLIKAFNTEAKAKAFASSTNTTVDYNLAIEPIKLE